MKFLKISVRVSVLFLFVSIPLSGEESDNSFFDLDNMLEHISILAASDDARVAGLEGEREAERYIYAALIGAGLEPERQAFPIAAFKRNYSELTLIANGEEQDIECESFLYSAGTKDLEEELSVIYGAFGDYENIEKPDNDHSCYLFKTGRYTFRTKAERAMEAGAVAAIVYNTSEKILRGTLGKPVDIPVLGINLSDGLAIRGAMESDSGSKLILKSSVILKDAESVNLCANIPGVIDTEKFLIVGAHYDSLDTPGANDNASGTAMLLELARSASGLELPFNLRIIFFGAEELGLLGSKYYAGNMTDSRNCIGMICLDVIAEGRLVAINSRMEDFGSDFQNFAYKAASKVVSNLMLYNSGYTDHEPFAEIGIPSIFISARPFTTYHTDLDNIDNLNPDILYDVGAALAAIIKAMAADFGT